MKKILYILSISIISLFMTTCNSLNDQETATVTIDTGIRATKAAAPTDVTSISVTVSGSGMSDMTRSIPTSTGIRTFEVPVGPARLFSVTAIGGTFSYAGSTTQDIPETGDVNVSINMVRQAATANLDIADFYFNSPASLYIDNYSVTVTQSGTTNSFTTTVLPADILSVEVPAGSQDITVTANINRTNQSAVTAASGSTTGIFTIGVSRTLDVNVGVTETKILIPDYQNQRIVQIDNLTVPNWQQRNRTDIDYLSDSYFYARDIEFDALGRLYIANDTPGSAGAYIVLRIDDITATTNAPLISTTGFGIDAMTIDRNNNLIHYAVVQPGPGVFVYTRNLDGSGSGSTDLTTSILSISGMAVDDNGLVYISGTNASSNPAIFVYNPTTTAIVSSVSSLDISLLTEPWHMLIKDTYLYVANSTTTGINNQILQLNLNTLELIQGYGTYSLVSTTEGNFYGPKHFVAILNRKIYVIDEGPDETETSKLISMDDFRVNWETYGSYGSGTDQFNFYYYC